MDLVREIEETLLDRKTVVYKAQFTSATPARAEIQNSIATMQKVDPKMVVVTGIKTNYGTNEVELTAQVYKNEGAYKALVSKSMAKKSEVKTPEPALEVPKEETAPEAPVEEAPAEEKKE